MSFCDWFISLSITSSRFVHVIVWDRISFLFKAWIIFQYFWIHNSDKEFTQSQLPALSTNRKIGLAILSQPLRVVWGQHWPQPWKEKSQKWPTRRLILILCDPFLVTPPVPIMLLEQSLCAWSSTQILSFNPHNHPMRYEPLSSSLLYGRQSWGPYYLVISARTHFHQEKEVIYLEFKDRLHCQRRTSGSWPNEMRYTSLVKTDLKFTAAHRTLSPGRSPILQVHVAGQKEEPPDRRGFSQAASLIASLPPLEAGKVGPIFPRQKRGNWLWVRK